MSSSNSTNRSGSQITTPLLIVFVVLKLTGNIDWSWWWVLSPLWIPLVIAILFLALGAALVKSNGSITEWPRKD